VSKVVDRPSGMKAARASVCVLCGTVVLVQISYVFDALFTVHSNGRPSSLK